MISGPRRTWIGRLSAAARSSCSAVSTAHEKSWAIVRMPERPVRNSVLAILRAMPLKRAVSTAMRMPSIFEPTATPALASAFAIFCLLSNVDDEGADIVADRGGAGVDDDRREARFDDRR